MRNNGLLAACTMTLLVILGSPLRLSAQSPASKTIPDSWFVVPDAEFSTVSFWQPPPPPVPETRRANPAQTPSTALPAAPNPLPEQPRLTMPQAPSGPLSPFANPGQNQRPYLARMSRAPDMFGDSFSPVFLSVDGAQASDIGINSTGPAGLDGTVQGAVPLGGGLRRFKNEQVRALPTDRVYFLYNHFHNALELSQTPGTTGIRQTTSNHIDQFTIGFEKTFLDGDWSVEVRMPFSGQTDLGVPQAQFNADGVGNLTIGLKHLLYLDDSFAIAAGLAVTSPTGSDAVLNLPTVPGRIVLHNNAVHLLPYAAIQLTPDENWFFHSFVQVDVAANPDQVSMNFPTSITAPVRNGQIIEQTLMYLDASAGYWWYHSSDDDDVGLTGLASILEFHYTTTLNDAKNANLGTGDFFTVGNNLNRFDVVNMTVGAHSEWSRHTLVRLATVVPLGSERNRFFDSEIQLSVIRRF